MDTTFSDFWDGLYDSATGLFESWAIYDTNKNYLELQQQQQLAAAQYEEQNSVSNGFG